MSLSLSPLVPYMRSRLRCLLPCLMLLGIVAAVRADIGALPRDPVDVAAIDMQKAIALFNLFRGQDDLALHAAHDGCYARCHLMSMRLRQMGVEVRRVWAFAPPKSRLHAKTLSGRAIDWDWHVAPIVAVHSGDKVDWLVFDPCLFNRPTAIDDWTRAMTSKESLPQLTATRLGEPPIRSGRRLAGSGYWTDRDPPEGPSVHALKTLKGFGK